MLTEAQLVAIMPYAKPRAAQFLDPLNHAMGEFGIGSKLRQAAFLATIAHESAQLASLSENLNYSAASLRRVWPNRFPPEVVTFYDRQPEKIANRAYANRMGNGDEDSGDGWRYRGAGLIQITGKDAHAACAKHFNLSLADMAAWLRTPLGACMASAWWWNNNDINRYADQGDFDGVCDKVNLGRKTKAEGDALGYADRREFYDTALQVLA